ncbi:hypothetical protein KSP40_PGU017763 [Platanthera guangdongensis]|uniref:COX assembly mitochondrial protein n=1 Tax=Platanthera guangdongensis TaxID=2320717 RepID=A0ABR2MSI3_9ASPA
MGPTIRVLARFDLLEAQLDHLRSTLRRKPRDLGQATDATSSAPIEIRDPTLGFDPSQFDEIQCSRDLEQKALKECDNYVAKYAECASGKTLSVIWLCRRQANELNECLRN